MANKGVKVRAASQSTTVLNVALRVSTLQTSSMVNCEEKGKIIYRVANTLDVPLGLQKIGSDDRGGTVINVGELIYIEESSTVMIVVDEAERISWMGCRIQSDDNNIPTTGSIIISMIVESK